MYVQARIKMKKNDLKAVNAYYFEHYVFYSIPQKSSCLR